MSDPGTSRVYLDPDNPEHTIAQLAITYDLGPKTLAYLRRVLALFPRPTWLTVEERYAALYDDMPLIDKFTFDIDADELFLFSAEPAAFIDGMIEMAMYLNGFMTMIGVDDQWMIEFTIGAWKPVKNQIKKRLGIPVYEEPQWVIGAASPDEWSPDAPISFYTLVSELNLVSFTQMVQLAARDEIEVNFPDGVDPRVVEVYVRMKIAMQQVADDLDLDDWREFNHRLLGTVHALDIDYQPNRLPIPAWWSELPEGPNPIGSLPGNSVTAVEDLPLEESEDADDGWNPFAEFIDQLFDDSRHDAPNSRT